MTKLATVFAVAFVAIALLVASTSHGGVERQTTAPQIVPLQMMVGQQLSPAQTTNYSLVFE